MIRVLGPDLAAAPSGKAQRVSRLLEAALRPHLPLHTRSAAELRRLYEGGVFGPPPQRLDAIAREDRLPGCAQPLRVFAPPESRGAALYLHGGGFIMGARDRQDARLWSRAQRWRLTILALGYPLAPEQPFPAADEAALAAARELLSSSPYGPLRLISGDSAGARIALSTLLGLAAEERRGLRGILRYGVYDLRMSPSARRWGERPLLINSPLMARFHELFLAGADPSSAAASPILDDLDGLPPLLLLCGAEDPLIDDSLFLHARLRAAGVAAELLLFPGLPHGFDALPIPEAAEAEAATAEWLARP